MTWPWRFGILAFVSWPLSLGLVFLALASWPWLHGLGFVSLASCPWLLGLGFLASASWPRRMFTNKEFKGFEIELYFLYFDDDGMHYLDWSRGKIVKLVNAKNGVVEIE